MRRKTKRRIQTPVRGGRERLSPRVIKEIDRVVWREAERYNVSVSFVIATALAGFFGIKVEEKYND